jgi:hypothetical protein
LVAPNKASPERGGELRVARRARLSWAWSALVGPR